MNRLFKWENKNGTEQCVRIDTIFGWVDQIQDNVNQFKIFSYGDDPYLIDDYEDQERFKKAFEDWNKNQFVAIDFSNKL